MEELQKLPKYKINFLEEVIEEINTIKERATSEEIEKLNFSTFNYKSPNACIYGQMTGYCESSRAKELYTKKYESINEHSLKSDIKEKGKTFTSLEVFLFYCTSATHKNIIDYLKGKTNILDLQFKK